MTDKERIKVAISWLINNGHASSQFDVGKNLDYNNKSSFSQVLNNSKPLPKKFINKFSVAYENINPDWLLTGKGEMTRKVQDVVQEESSEYNFNSNPKNDSMSLEQRVDYLEKIIDIQQVTIKQMSQQISELLVSKNDNPKKKESNVS